MFCSLIGKADWNGQRESSVAMEIFLIIIRSFFFYLSPDSATVVLWIVRHYNDISIHLQNAMRHATEKFSDNNHKYFLAIKMSVKLIPAIILSDKFTLAVILKWIAQ